MQVSKRLVPSDLWRGLWIRIAPPIEMQHDGVVDQHGSPSGLLLPGDAFPKGLPKSEFLFLYSSKYEL